MIKDLLKTTLILALGSGIALAQNLPRSQSQDTQQNPSTMPQAGTGASVQSDIQAALQKESSLASSNINVQVTGTSVELSGSAANQAAKDKAEEIARAHSGGMDVKNHIKVSSANPGPGDNPR